MKNLQIAAALLLVVTTASSATSAKHAPAKHQLGKTMAPAKAGGPAATATASVKIGNFTFNPAAITVKVGGTVTWVNGDDIPHTVMSKDKIFKSAVLDTGDHFSFTFTKAGQFVYFCSIHPQMTGRVTVVK